MREIRASAKNIRALLAGAKYGVDYYQREYKWQTKQVTELLDDLAGKFRESFEESDERSAVGIARKSVENSGSLVIHSTTPFSV
jgi:uncharacterized protein with ParB-like and HNH nuclease domain